MDNKLLRHLVGKTCWIKGPPKKELCTDGEGHFQEMEVVQCNVYIKGIARYMRMDFLELMAEFTHFPPRYGKEWLQP